MGKPKLKQLVWDKITTTSTDKTVWSNTTLENVKMDLQELESLFSLNDSTPQKNIIKEKSQKIQKPQVVSILDIKRAHNISIQLRSLRILLPKLLGALRDIDFDILTSEVLMVMNNTLPNEEDTKSLQNYKGDTSLLAEIEKYYLDLLKIPRYKNRIRSLIFKLQYKTTYEQTQQDLELLNRACDQLKSSQNLVKILEMVLVVGNHLNGGSFRGAASGFKLEALLKLMDVKGRQKNTTLLHFVVTELLKTDEQVGKLSEEMKEVKLVANLSLDRIYSNLKELERGVELMDQEIQEMRSNNSPINLDETKFFDTMVPFAIASKDEFGKLQILARMSLEKLKDVAMYFGESIKEDRQIDLFKTLREFLFMFDCACNDIKNRRKRKEDTTSTIHFRQRSKNSISPHKISIQIKSSCREQQKSEYETMNRQQPSQFLGQEKRPSTSANTPFRTNTSSPINCVGIVINAREKLMQSIQNQSQCYDSDWSTN
ncbi:hypothetical protein M758_4G034900 [Ceratodon purpureus]|nr:hypothetical protein M758_4G034900 [Ceratodon purpureus]